MTLLTKTKLLTSVLLLTASMASVAGSLEVNKEITINASPATTWKMIGGFNHLDVWHPVVVALVVPESVAEADPLWVGIPLPVMLSPATSRSPEQLTIVKAAKAIANPWTLRLNFNDIGGIPSLR